MKNRNDALKEEIDFWYRSFNKTFQDKDCSKMLNDPEHMKNRFPKLFLNCIGEYSSKRDLHELTCIEVGGGPFSNLAYGAVNNIFKLVSIDPLAKEYENLLAYYHCTSPIQFTEGTGERLFDFVKKGSFDLAYSRNALDHTEDPAKCIVNMVEALKPQGILFLMGFVREGSYENWKQLHQYDIWPENGVLYYAERNGDANALTADLNITCILQEMTSDLPGDRSYTIAFEKKSQ